MMLIKFAQCFKRNAVVGIHECQILDVEKTDDVRSLPVIHRDSVNNESNEEPFHIYPRFSTPVMNAFIFEPKCVHRIE